MSRQSGIEKVVTLPGDRIAAEEERSLCGIDYWKLGRLGAQVEIGGDLIWKRHSLAAEEKADMESKDFGPFAWNLNNGKRKKRRSLSGFLQTVTNNCGDVDPKTRVKGGIWRSCGSTQEFFKKRSVSLIVKLNCIGLATEDFFGSAGFCICVDASADPEFDRKISVFCHSEITGINDVVGTTPQPPGSKGRVHRNRPQPFDGRSRTFPNNRPLLTDW
jgi:hypothetical protein